MHGWTQSLLTVDLDAVIHNFNICRQLTGVTCIPVLKANAYGLGALEIAHALHDGADVHQIFVASYQEARVLHNSLPQIEFFILNGACGIMPSNWPSAKFIPVLHDAETIYEYAAHAHSVQKYFPIAIQVETGLQRLGLSYAAFCDVMRHPHVNMLDIRLVMSHLACAYQPSENLNYQQLMAFKKFKKFSPHLKYSLSGSGGFFLGKEFLFDCVRPGRLIYGSHLTAPETVAGQVRHVVSWHAPLLSMRHVLAGHAIGYNQSFIAPRDMTVGTLNVGYADGYPFQTHQTYVSFNGQMHSVIGRVSMDLMLIDLSSAVSMPHIGAWFELLGSNISIDQLACDAGHLTPSVILTGLGHRVHWTYRQKKNRHDDAKNM